MSMNFYGLYSIDSVFCLDREDKKRVFTVKGSRGHMTGRINLGVPAYKVRVEIPRKGKRFLYVL